MKYVFFALLAIVVAAVLFAYFDESGLIVSKDDVSKGNTNLLQQMPKLPVEGRAPELQGIVGWINLPAGRQGSEPLSLAELKGKVVLVDFWTYSCINCVRTFPHISAWHEKYKDNGFVLLGVHTPEFEFEKERENVIAAVEEYKLEYPVALDNDYKTWRAFENRFWPAHYLIDAEGNIRYHHFGEGRYAETESAIQSLLLEAGLLTIDKITRAEEPPAGVDFQKIGTPEIYLGYSRINNFGNQDQGVKPGEPFTFSEPEEILENRFYLVGNWNIQPEFSELISGKGKILLRYKANKVNMVLDTRDDAEVEVSVKLDGKDLVNMKINEPRLYNLADTGEDYGWHTLEITIPSPGFRAFTFTFG